MNSSIKDKVNEIEGIMVNVNDRTCDLEVEILRQRKCNQKEIQTVPNQITDMEYELATHIETVKSNMESELEGINRNQKSLENKLSEFTEEMQNQNMEMNNKIQNLREDFHQLKTVDDRAEESIISNDRVKGNIFSTENSYSNPPSLDSYSTGARSSPSNTSSLGSYFRGARCTCSLSNGSVASNEDTLYMFGDPTRSLIIDGLSENMFETLGETIVRCVKEIGVELTPNDIESVHRIGKINSPKQEKTQTCQTDPQRSNKKGSNSYL